MAYALIPLATQAGVNPTPDSTAFATPLFTASQGIRMYNGKPEKIGGWVAYTFDMGNLITGAPRMIYTQLMSTTLWTLIGTNTRLYAINQSTLTNITPLVTGTTSLSGALATNYTTLGTNPIQTTINSPTIVVTHTAHHLQPGDDITFASATAVGGFTTGDINTAQVVRSTTTNTYTVTLGHNATSTAAGGGTGMIEETGIITVTQTAHGFNNGDRVKILSALAVGGVTALQINLEFVIRGVTTNTYDLTTAGLATSSATGGGGTGTTVQGQIAAGSVDQIAGIGYGVGKYGVGLYGTSKSSSTLQVYPQLWTADNFGNNMMITPGNQGGLYQWLGDPTVAPTLLTNAPTAINYLFVSNDIIVTLGASATPNRIQWSDVGNSTIWTATAQNQAGQEDIEAAGTFLSHAQINGIDVLFTADQLYTFSYIGLPLIWQLTKVTNGQGIISQNARIVVDGVVYWMGINGFYGFNGAQVSPIPSNIGNFSTIKKYVFGNLNYSQQSKIFCGYTEQFNEVSWYYPSANSDECDSVIRLCLNDNSWTPDKLTRTAFEYPYVKTQNPKMIDINGLLYNHEVGSDANGAALNWSLTTPMYWQQWNVLGNNITEIGGIVQDNIQTGDINLAVTVFPYIMSTSTSLHATSTTNYTLYDPNDTPPVQDAVTGIQISGRMWQYTLSQTGVIGGFFRMGNWLQLLQMGPLDQ